jgi:ATP-dependent helicase/nuclease subunit A
MDKSAGVTQNRWPDKDLAKAQAEAFQKFREEVVISSLDRWRSYCHPFIMDVVVPAVGFFKKVRERHSQMNYHDLLLSATELLRNHPEVREYFQERFTQLLVDEFQDTDPIQAEVILLLAGRDSQETSWHKVAVKPGALFIVGDPKQSIYRFRRADIGVYNEVKEIITRSGGQVIPLTTNFRSLPTLCRWVNPIFKEKFPNRANKFQPAFEELVPFKTSPGGGVRKITLGDVKGNIQATIARMDAQRIAAYIRWAISGNLELLDAADGKETPSTRKAVPGDFMILSRYKQHLPIYAGEMEAQGLPYEISGGGDFNQSEELSQLMNLLAALAEPDDPVALTATLRRMFYGVSDDLLYRFKKGGGFFSYQVSPSRCTDPQARDRMEAVFSDLREMHQWTRSGPPAAALGRILSRLGLIPLARTREMGESRSGNILKALEIALMESGKGVTSFPEMVEKLREYIDEVEVEGMPIEPGKEDVVRVMNLHKAKGLEAPVVFLADPIREVSREPDLHITRKGKKAKGYFTAFQQLAEYKREMIGLPPDWEQYKNLEQEYQQAEEERLLYVAVTRAMQLLIVSQYPKKSDKGAWKDLTPYLASIQELEYSTVPAPVPVTEKITTQRFQAGKQSIADGLARSKEPSYRVETVTKKSKASGEEAPFTQDTGRGFSWGRILHKLLEVVALDESADLDLMAENLLKEEERPLLEKPLVMETVKGIISSDLWKRMKKATAAYVEVPFSLKVIETGLPQIVSGAIDLVFREPDGWVIADYKTDAVDGNLDKLVTYYRPQVELYKKFWEEMTGERVKEAGLFFVGLNQWVAIG